jgi:hypothetical protein
LNVGSVVTTQAISAEQIVKEIDPFHQRVDSGTGFGNDGAVQHDRQLSVRAPHVRPFLNYGTDTPRLIGYGRLEPDMPRNVTPMATRVAEDQPPRTGAHTQSLADHAAPATDERRLPTLDDGITLLDIEGGRGVPLLQSLVLDHLLLHDGPAVWIDADGHATTTTLARLAPSQRVLDRIHVARGVTAYQHYSMVCDLPTAVNHAIREATHTTRKHGRQSPADPASSPQSPSLLVAPVVGAPYRESETLDDAHAETLHARTLARLSTYADSYDVPVLVTRRTRDAITRSLVNAADHHLECTQTRLGPRIVGDEFETLIYPVDDGGSYQTTVAYWQQLLAARATQVGVASTPTARSTDDTADVGTGVTAAGERTTLGADPLCDAWTTPGPGGR